MDDRFERPTPWVPWAITSVALVLVALVAYGAGAHREAAMVAGDPSAHVWHRHGFHPILGLLLFLFLFGGLRRMWWGGYGCCGPWRRHRYERWHDEMRDDWETWHRREHERMDTPRGTSAPPASDRQ